MIYICEVCKTECKSLTSWIIHYHTEKHKENIKKATHICINCCSAFVYKKNDKSMKIFECHIKECKKNVFDEVMKMIDIEEIREENNKLKKEIGTVKNFKEENIKLKEEIKYLNKIESEFKDLKNENKDLKNENKIFD